MKKFLIVLFAFSLSFVKGQDNKLTLSLDEMLEIVRNNHPVVRQANIKIELSEAEILKSKSGFEPSLNAGYGEKTFGESNYYNDFSSGLSIPTWFGIEVYAGINDLTGEKINPTSTFNESNYIGASIPLLKNLLMDERRATLKQSKLYNEMSEVERQVIINDLLMEVIDVYYNWAKFHELNSVLSDNLNYSEKRMDFIRQSFNNGEYAEIDTVEAFTQLQTFQIRKKEVELELIKSLFQLSSFSWKENNIPYEFPLNLQPEFKLQNNDLEAKFNLILENLITDVANHPELKKYDLKQDVLTIDKQLKQQSLLPKLDVYYNYLGKGYDVRKSLTNHNYFVNDYQYGLKFELPLLLMKGRADYKIAKLKLEQNTLDLNQKQYQLNLKVKSYYNEYSNLKSQLDLQTNMYSNYKRLVEAEEQKLLNGESSMFMINSRQMKALDALEKLVKLQAKYNKTIYAVIWSTGKLQ
jgi:outer membrane protein TolC